MSSYSSHYKWVLTSKPGSHPVHSWVNILAGMSKEELDARWERLKEARTKRYQARAARGGWTLVAYHWEHETFPEFREFRVEKDRAMYYIKKLARHFKTSCPNLSRIQKRGGGHYSPTRLGVGVIALPNHPSLGLICHEFAHHLDTVRNPDTKHWHGKTFKKELKKVYTFAKRYLPVDKPVA